MEKSIFEQMGGNYHQDGDYFLPDLAPPENISVGIWGQRRRQYLKTQCGTIYTGLLLSGELNGHLAETDAQTQAMFFQLVDQLAKQAGITEQLKAINQMEWVRRMNSIRKSGRRNYLDRTNLYLIKQTREHSVHYAPCLTISRLA